MADYEPKPLSEQVPAAIAALAEVAAQQVLVLCVGAGVSIAAPTDLPSGNDAGRRLYAALRRTGHEDSVRECDESDLLCIADMMERVAGGEDLVQSMLREVADFTNARPNFGHQVLALLVLEGAIELLSLNWDTCVERSPLESERVEVVVSAEDFRNVRGARFHKIHGCAVRGPLLAISTRQIASVPQWVLDELGTRLSGAVIAFVGIGDIPTYIKERIVQLKTRMEADRIHIVDPQISPAWSDLLPELTNARKVVERADGFLDALVRGYVRSALRRFLNEIEDPQQMAAFNVVGIDMALGSRRLGAAIDSIDARSFIVFCRRAHHGWDAPNKVVQSPELRTFLAAAAALAATADTAFERREILLSYAAPAGKRYVEPILAKGQSGAAVARSASRRIQLAAAAGRYGPGDHVIIVAEGHIEPLPLPNVPSSIMGMDQAGELVSTPDASQVQIVSASDLLRGRLPTEWN